MKLSDWLRGAADKLAAQGIESAALEAQVLAAHAFGVDRTQVLIHGDWPIPQALDALLERRLAREPLAYLVGLREFYGHRFMVRPGVLIPRHETETLVDAALELALPTKVAALDIGTGSGCIAISLALARPSWRVAAVDISAEALQIARTNADALGASVEFFEGDGLGHLPWTGRFDLIVSNPPYVGVDDALPPEVAHHEPPIALYAGADGLDFYRVLASRALGWLNPGGWLLLEVGDTQSAAVETLLEEAGWAVHPSVPDLAGIPRVVRAQGP